MNYTKTPPVPSIPTPAELRDRIEKEDAAAIDALIARVTAALTREWTPSVGRVVVDVKEPVRVVDVVVRRLMDRGWQATATDSQRDGRSLTIVPAPPHVDPKLYR